MFRISTFLISAIVATNGFSSDMNIKPKSIDPGMGMPKSGKLAPTFKLDYMKRVQERVEMEKSDAKISFDSKQEEMSHCKDDCVEVAAELSSIKERFERTEKKSECIKFVVTGLEQKKVSSNNYDQLRFASDNLNANFKPEKNSVQLQAPEGCTDYIKEWNQGFDLYVQKLQMASEKKRKPAEPAEGGPAEKPVPSANEVK